MTWRTDQRTATATAVGGKGRYQIAYRTGAYILAGVGHDGLTMLALVPPRRYHRLETAKDAAAALDRNTIKEPEISGC